MSGYWVNSLCLPSDLYSMIYKECKRQKDITGVWPGIYPAIIDALYSHFNAIEASYKKEFSE